MARVGFDLALGTFVVTNGSRPAMGSVIPFPMRYARQTSGDVGAHGKCRQNAPDCLWNSAEPPGDVFDKMVARIRVARCYMLCHTQLSAVSGRQRSNVSRRYTSPK